MTVMTQQGLSTEGLQAHVPRQSFQDNGSEESTSSEDSETTRSEHERTGRSPPMSEWSTLESESRVWETE